MIFNGDLDNPLKELEHGMYRLECETIYSADLTYEKIKEHAENFEWFSFYIKSFRKMELK